jgi:hypothetical protein
MRTFSSLSAFALLLSGHVFAAADKPALPWLPMHTHTEMMYSPLLGLSKKVRLLALTALCPLHSVGVTSEHDARNNAPCNRRFLFHSAVQPVFYDFIGKRYRADVLTSMGLPQNGSSFWLGDDLYIYSFDVNTCQHLNMGFGMMVPGT